MGRGIEEATRSMSILNFGSTWWGKEWIRALELLDSSSNRLRRGKAYARKEAVKSIEFKDRSIRAKVQGSRQSPYIITLELTAFTYNEKRRVENLLKENPSIFGEFLVGKMSKNILNFFTHNQIKLFPEKWEELSSTCSCPDWADPCKHRAAVFYLLANEIDKNPSLLLEWRGIDPKAITGKHKKSSISDSRRMIFLPATEAKVLKTEIDSFLSLQIPSAPIQTFFQFLDENPIFYNNGNFKKVLLLKYQENLESLVNLEFQEYIPHYLSKTDFKFLFKNIDHEPRIFVNNEEFIKDKLQKKFILEKIKVPKPSKGRIYFEEEKGLTFSIKEIIEYFIKYPLLYKSKEISDSGRYISHCISFAISLISSKSYLPQLLWISESSFSIQYNPIYISEEARNNLKNLETLFQPYYGFSLESESTVLSNHSISFIIKYFLDNIVRYNLRSYHGSLDKIQSVFFEFSSGFVPESYKDENIGKSIENWLERFSNFKNEVTPLIQVERKTNKIFSISLYLEKKGDPLSIPIPISEIFENSQKKILGEVSSDLKLKLIRQILLAGEKIPELIIALNSKGRQSIDVDLNRMSEILLKEKSLLEFIGIRFILPKELINLLKPKVIYEAKTVSTIKYISLENLQEFNPKITLNGKPISEKEKKLLEKSAGKLIPFRDGYVLIDPKELEALLSKKSRDKKPTKMELLFSLLTGIFDGSELEIDKRYSDFIENLLKVDVHNLPAGLNATLRPYQKIGFEWMYSNLSKGINPILADDMGLGKTLQVITVVQKLKEDNKLKNQCLIVCPTSLLGNWSKEIEKFSQNLSSNIYHGNQKSFSSDANIIITSYGNLRVSAKYFSNRPWDCLVLDEAQNIKNPFSEQAKVSKSIHSKYKIAMSGTPVENRLTELWSIFDFVNPDFLGSLSTFKKDMAIPIERFRDMHLIQKLKTATAPFLLRRLKTDKSIISDLPNKNILQEYPSLTQSQELLYKATLDKYLKPIENSKGISRKALILNLILKLKQICNHPSQFNKKRDFNPELSGKTVLLLDILKKILYMNEKVILFTQYTAMGDILKAILEKEFSTPVDFFKGSLSKKQREDMIDEFQKNEQKNILVISLKAGGTGLNLVSANNVIHFDLWWNPAVEEQATDRVFRIGQKKNVNVFRMVTLGTFEEKIDDIMKQKRELAELTVSQGEKWITELSNSELKKIFELKER